MAKAQPRRHVATSPRIRHLDGLRGIAILMVYLFHAYSRWNSLMPYSDSLSGAFQFGWLGVELFFLISGFVILMTLENSNSIIHFLYKRWLRLFPAMLFCSLLIYATADLLPERPAGPPRLIDLLPGLTFTDPYYWQRLTRLPINAIEGAFWSLFVEFKFYIVAAIAYFMGGRTALIATLLVTFVFSLAGRITDTPYFMRSISEHLSSSYYGWFASGAAFYIYHQVRKTTWLYSALLLGLTSAFSLSGRESQNEQAVILAACLVVVFFAMSMSSQVLQNFLQQPIFQFLGLVSYPLYLFHESMLVALTIQWAPWVSTNWKVALPVGILLLQCLIAWLIVKHVEPLIRKALTRTASNAPPRQ